MILCTSTAGYPNYRQNGEYPKTNTQYVRTSYGPQIEKPVEVNSNSNYYSTENEKMPYVAGYTEDNQNVRKPSAMGYGESISPSNDQWYQDVNAEKAGNMS